MLTILESFVSMLGSCRTRSPIGCSGKENVEALAAVGPRLVAEPFDCEGSERVLGFRLKNFCSISMFPKEGRPFFIGFQPNRRNG